ncbi:MAG: hypothetical protein A2V45_01205 [Candidatus Aminicenantes bacterium RBG_19FT_COMBO_58_17]|nr:MAG: hypothetical protein A2V45_01205 [Candidatus Aminicenantes bacterium RBG_19FT_COMBO_58_17]
MTLPEARAEANRAFKDAKRAILAGEISARAASESLISTFWGIGRDLKGKDKMTFYAWFDRKHAQLGKEVHGLEPGRARLA